MNIPEGYELIQGRSGENARKALSLAQERGHPVESVRTTTDGYLVLEDGQSFVEVGGYLQAEVPQDGADESDEVTLADHTIPELKDIADKAGIDLEGATLKADIVAAIEKSDKNPVPSAAGENKGE